MFCMNCGKALPDGAKFCMYCGTPLGAAAAPAQSGCCLPGRKYLSCDTLYPGGAYTETPAYQHDRERMRASELASAPYSGFDFTNYVRLENGAMVGFVFGHTTANRAAEDYYNNLYLLTQDGHAVFLHAGGRRCTGLFVQDNEVHWTENGQTHSVPLPL